MRGRDVKGFSPLTAAVPVVPSSQSTSHPPLPRASLRLWQLLKYRIMGLSDSRKCKWSQASKRANNIKQAFVSILLSFHNQSPFIHQVTWYLFVICESLYNWILPLCSVKVLSRNFWHRGWVDTEQVFSFSFLKVKTFKQRLLTWGLGLHKKVAENFGRAPGFE